MSKCVHLRQCHIDESRYLIEYVTGGYSHGVLVEPIYTLVKLKPRILAKSNKYPKIVIQHTYQGDVPMVPGKLWY